MTSFHVITNSEKFREATQEILRSVGLDWTFEHVPVSPQFPPLPGSFILAGDDLDQEIVLQRIRRSNPLHPIVLYASPSENQEKLQKFQPLLLCRNSKEFIDNLHQAHDLAVKNQDKMQKLQQVAAYFAEGKAKEAYLLILQLEEGLDPGLFETLKAKAYWGMSKLTPALNCAEKAVALNPQSPDVLEILARIYNSQGQRSKALALLHSHHQDIEHDVECVLLLADLYLEDGKLKESKDSYDRVLKISAHNPAARTGKFVVGVIDGSVKAIRSDKGATQTALELAKICNVKAIALVNAQQYQLAENLYRNTIALLPDKRIEYKLLMNLGLCMKKAGDHQRALQYFEEGQRKAPPRYKRFAEQIAALDA